MAALVKRGAETAFSKHLVLILLALLGLFLAASVAVVFWLAHQHNALASENARTMVKNRLDSRSATLKSFAVDYSHWDAAVPPVGARDAGWISSNMMTFDDQRPFDMLNIVYADGTELVWRNDHGPEPAPSILPAPLRERMVSAQRGADERPFPTTWNTAWIDGELWRFATTFVAPHTRPATDAELANAPITIFGRRLTPEGAAAMGEAISVKGLTVVSEPPETDSMDALPIRDPQGKTVAYLTWSRPVPGSAILTRLATPLILVLLGLIAVATAIVSHIGRSASRLEQALEDALAADRAKSEFLTTVSHELRTPMNGVLGVAQILETTTLDDDQTELLGLLKDSAKGQMELIEDLLSFGEIEAGVLHMDNRIIDLPVLVTEATAPFTIAAATKGLTLDVTLPEDAPAILGDAKRLKQVIANLVGNAVKFTDDGGAVTVTTKVTEQNDMVARLRVIVADDGPGIPSDQHTRIFERFTQADGSIRRTKGGTGLGLAISRALAEEMGGTIVLLSAPGAGSTFTLDVSLPVAQNAGSKAPTKVAA